MSHREFLELDKRHMALALELADQGRYTTTPNPRVGSVIAHGERVVGTGWHRKAGEAHAEVLALAEAGEQSKGATVYVTLEPCCFQGRTGPCTEALINAGVSRVICAMLDPNDRVAGDGVKRLLAAGIEVDVGLLEDQAELLNRGYIKRMRSKLPFVRMKLASSIDGRSAMASGESQWITGPEARDNAQQLRAESCAIVTGIDTILCDDPRYTLREESLGSPVQRQPDLWVCDSHFRAQASLNVFSTSKALGRHVVNASLADDIAANETNARALRAQGVELLPVNAGSDGHVDLSLLLEAAAEKEINELLVEAGPRLSAGFLKQELVDEVVWYVAPKILGSGARAVVDLSFTHLADAIELEILSQEVVGQDTKITAKIRG